VWVIYSPSASYLLANCGRQSLNSEGTDGYTEPDNLLSRVKTYPLYDAEKRLFAFEIGNLGIDRRGVCRIVETIPGVTLTRRPKLLSWFREQVFCEFLVDGAEYIAEKPLGDNSRYWIGPNPPRWLPQTEKVHRIFARR